jgi:transposase
VEKKLHDQVGAVSAAHPQAAVEVWYQDEARLGLKPIVRRVWARRGQRPRAPRQTRYAWVYVYGFVHPERGETYWLILPTVSIEAMTLALREFARDAGAGPAKQVVLVLDQAGWHTSGKVTTPAGITLMPLPAKTPELQPAERLWPLVREGVANQAFPDVDALQTRLVERCLQLRQVPEQIRALTRYHWLPAY